jgi:hypothetical protein
MISKESQVGFRSMAKSQWLNSPRERLLKGSDLDVTELK